MVVALPAAAVAAVGAMGAGGTNAARASVLPMGALLLGCDGLGFSFALLFFFLALAFAAAPYVQHGATRFRVCLSCGPNHPSPRPTAGPVRCHTCEQPTHQSASLSTPRMT
eukprot:COSAG06_NODE_1209_length_10254_cov_75.924175_9_plen_111_part_00